MKDVLEEIISSYYSCKEYPCLRSLCDIWSKTQPLRGKKILIATPIFRNTIAEYIALLAGGAEIVLAYGAEISYDPNIVACLKKIGIPVITDKEKPTPFDLILDCAGMFSSWPSVLGYVELTRSGWQHYSGSEKPAFMADSGKIKQIETVLGTGESYFRAMERLGYLMEKGARLLVFGSGKVGRGIITQAFRREFEIELVTQKQLIDKSMEKMLKKVIFLEEKEKIKEAVLRADYIVTATGVKSAFSSVCSSKILANSKAVCANMGVEDEFGESVSENRILEQKRSLNFILEEPTHLKYIDATLALHAYGAVYLCQHPLEKGIILPPEDIEKELIEITIAAGLIGDELKASGLYAIT